MSQSRKYLQFDERTKWHFYRTGYPQMERQFRVIGVTAIAILTTRNTVITSGGTSTVATKMVTGKSHERSIHSDWQPFQDHQCGLRNSSPLGSANGTGIHGRRRLYDGANKGCQTWFLECRSKSAEEIRALLAASIHLGSISSIACWISSIHMVIKGYRVPSMAARIIWLRWLCVCDEGSSRRLVLWQYTSSCLVSSFVTITKSCCIGGDMLWHFL